jgi:hypothetical protein
MRVELLFSDDDPNAMEARQRLVEVLIEDAFETPIQMVAVTSLDDARFLDFRGSPTIRIDGVDVFPDAAGEVGLHLRQYPAEGDGAPEPIPSKMLIRRAVEAARGWSHGAPVEPAAKTTPQGAPPAEPG